MITLATAKPGMKGYKFTLLLVTLVLFLAINPYFTGKGTVASIAFNVFVLLVVVAAVYAVQHRTRSLVIAATLAAGTVIGSLVGELTDNQLGKVFGFLLLGLLWAYSGGSILASILSRRVVTLTTLGYGDLLARSPPAQAFSFLENALGQVYLAVLVARLLGLHLARIQGPGSDAES